MGTAAWRFLVDAIHHRVVECLALAAGMSVADVGCGAGRLAVQIARVVAPGEVVGIDISPKAVRAAERRAQSAGLFNARFIVAGTGNGTLREGRFDRAVFVAVLGEIPDRGAAWLKSSAPSSPEDCFPSQRSPSILIDSARPTYAAWLRRPVL